MNEVGAGLNYRGHRITYCDFSRQPYLVGRDRITEGYTFSAAPGATWGRTVEGCKELIDCYEDTKGMPVNDWGGFWVEWRERHAAKMGQVAYKGFFIRRGDVWRPTSTMGPGGGFDVNDKVYFIAKHGKNALPNRPDGGSAYFNTIDEAIVAIDVFSSGYQLDDVTLWLKVDTAICADHVDVSLHIENVHQAHVLVAALDRYIERLPKDGEGKTLLVGSTAEQRLRNARNLLERLNSILA